MRVKFIGVGEAFDEDLPNTSIWVQSEDGGKKSSILLDCGFTAPPAFWRNCSDPDELDAVWISHFHGDHFFGLPALLTRFWESKRTKPLLILGQQGVDEVVRQTLKLAYSSILDKFAFDLNFLTVEPESSMEAAGATWRTAVNNHSQKDLAVRITWKGKSIFYSGDGLATGETLSLAQGADLIIHEAFRLEDTIPGHGSIMSSIEFAQKAKAHALALVHIQRQERRTRRDEILRVIGGVKDVRIMMPEPDDEYEV
ncbi:MAG: MBL fold metallo-hydrolase [Syntrophobacteraceae bacterium]